MGLFGSKVNKEEAERKVWDSLAKGEMIRYLARWIQKKDPNDDLSDGEWIFTQDGYYDDCKRTVVLTTDTVMIFKCSVVQVREVGYSIKSANFATDFALTKNGEVRAEERRREALDSMNKLKSVDCVGFNCTSYGYSPLTSFEDLNTNTVISEERVLQLWAGVVKNLMKQLFEDITFGNVDAESDVFGTTAYSFGFTIPHYEWKSWF